MPPRGTATPAVSHSIGHRARTGGKKLAQATNKKTIQTLEPKNIFLFFMGFMVKHIFEQTNPISPKEKSYNSLFHDWLPESGRLGLPKKQTQFKPNSEDKTNSRPYYLLLFQSVLVQIV